MEKSEKKIWSDYITENKLSDKDLSQLRNWISNDHEDSEVNIYLREEWEKEDEMETDVLYSGIQKEIVEREKDVKKNRVFMRAVIKYQKIAAVILLPFIAFLVFITLNQKNQDQAYFETIAESGQKSTLVLPDGTKVWLNSDSRIRYPDTFGKRNRTVQLTGEAYFEVAKDKRRPFLVEAGEVNIRVLGTTFNIKAYPDENEIETILLEGSIELTARLDAKSALKPVIMEPGQSLRFNKVENKLQHIPFDNEEVLGWTNNRLIFRNDSFDNLVRRIERWYDVEIIYDESSLKNQRLTVELYEGELLDRLLGIIELAMNVECISEKDKIYIKTKR